MFKDELKRLRKAKNMTQEDLAAILGITKSSVSMYENGRRNPDFALAEAIAAYFRVDMNILLAQSPEAFRAVKIPVYDTVPAGITLEAIQDILDYEEITPEMASNGEYFALRINGHSMEPRIWDGDNVIVRISPDVESGQVAIVIINGENATCKQIKKHENGISLLPFNQTYAPSFYTWDEVNSLPVRIIGQVVELRGRF